MASPPEFKQVYFNNIRILILVLKTRKRCCWGLSFLISKISFSKEKITLLIVTFLKGINIGLIRKKKILLFKREMHYINNYYMKIFLLHYLFLIYIFFFFRWTSTTLSGIQRAVISGDVLEVKPYYSNPWGSHEINVNLPHAGFEIPWTSWPL